VHAAVADGVDRPPLHPPAAVLAELEPVAVAAGLGDDEQAESTMGG
jgi:hypothetical protein